MFIFLYKGHERGEHDIDTQFTLWHDLSFHFGKKFCSINNFNIEN